MSLPVSTGVRAFVASLCLYLSANTPAQETPDPAGIQPRQRVSINEGWRCRGAEIGAEIGHYAIGEKPGPPDTLSASYAGGYSPWM